MTSEAGRSVEAGAMAPVSDIWDRPGALTIVVQGGLTVTNLGETARHCVHWRAICPAAQIVLAISTTDILQGSEGREVELHDPRLVARHEHDGALQAAIARLRAACDVIVLSKGALPLPWIKFETVQKPNNVNLQIAAAQAGLSRATGEYTLRIRSDMVFVDRSFLTFYDAHKGIRRGSSRVFRERVMISPYYTLNPFTLERLPFHFSDWFHFGLTEDVRSIWTVDEMSLADAVHHNFQPHMPEASRLERKFRVRFAVEQHIILHALRIRDRGISFEHMTDARAAQSSIEILLSDFLVCDVARVPFLFDKYARTLRDPASELLCITYPQWRRLVDMPANTDFSSVYADATRRAKRRIAIRNDPALRPVKFLLGAARFLGRKLGLRRPASSKAVPSPLPAWPSPPSRGQPTDPSGATQFSARDQGKGGL